uniref:Ig-like domain-containing protein n=1 Tax=Sinocyclocheilus grahami TaxID=75366 RepID=A0A672MZ24_SINGR
MRSIILLILSLHCGREIFLCFSLFHFAGDSDVSQVPSVLMAVNGSSVQLNCTHKKDFIFTQMYWYRQRSGQTMTLIVFTSTLDKFVANKTVAESGSLTVNNFQPNDSATYLCSLSEYTVYQTQGRAVQKTGVLKLEVSIDQQVAV